jgi:hypothetical protein
MDTFTIPLEGRKQRVVSTHAKCAPSIEGCQSRTMAGYGGSSRRSIRDVVPHPTTHPSATLMNRDRGSARHPTARAVQSSGLKETFRSGP